MKCPNRQTIWNRGSSNKAENLPRKQATEEAHAKYNKTTAFCITELTKTNYNKLLMFSLIFSHEETVKKFRVR